MEYVGAPRSWLSCRPSWRDVGLLPPYPPYFAFSAALFLTILLMLETLGTLSWLQTPSASSLSRISQANMVGFSFLYLLIASTTCGVATLGLLPPITPALKLPVSKILSRYYETGNFKA